MFSLLVILLKVNRMITPRDFSLTTVVIKIIYHEMGSGKEKYAMVFFSLVFGSIMVKASNFKKWNELAMGSLNLFPSQSRYRITKVQSSDDKDIGNGTNFLKERVLKWKLRDLYFNPNSVTDLLCELGQVPSFSVLLLPF